ncbi:MAG TPA: hypothetical protein VFD36_26830 [Kofleriaceae bacterium]|nr:hypothetical protein [Kofleriaceae bacterium]
MIARADRATRAAGSVGAALAGALAAACSTPVPHLQLALADTEDQKCPFVDCSLIPMPCKTVMSLKFLDRDDPSVVYHEQCDEVPFDTTKNSTLCSLKAIDIEPVLLPVRDMEVQVALYPASVIPSKPGVAGGPDQLQCPSQVAYSVANGYPVENWPTPALGGRTFYHPGDATVTVRLGCTDLTAIEQSCAISDLVTVTATVDSFATLASVDSGPSGTASRLRVSVGEPRIVDGGFELRPDDTHTLQSVGGNASIPTWQSELDIEFNRYVCVDVLEAVAQTTAVLRCKPVSAGPRLDATGMWISRDDVQRILSALSPSMPDPVKFPDEGLTVGIVVDQAAIGIPGVVVTPAMGSVKYLTGQGMLSTTGTSNNGIFVSRDAPFGTMFATSRPGRPTVTGVGGMVAGKITVVVLQLDNPPP